MAQDLSVRLNIDTSQGIANIANLANITEKEFKRMVRAQEQANKLQAEQNKLMRDAGAAASSYNDIARGAEGASHATAGMTRELLVLGHELSQGNFKRFGGSLLVLAEYSKGATAALHAFVGPLGLLVGAFGAFALAAIEGAKESHEFNKSLILTGNYAGITAGEMDRLSQKVEMATGKTVGASRAALQALIDTGEFGPASLEKAATAVTRVASLSGRTADEVAKDFAKMQDGVAKWAAEHNKQWNFLTASQYEYIRSLEEHGQKEEAIGVVLGRLNERLNETRTFWQKLSQATSEAWDMMLGNGHDATVEDRLDAINRRLLEMDRIAKARGKSSIFDSAPDGPGGASRAALLDERRLLLLDQLRQKNNALEQAESARVQKAGIAAREYLDRILEESKSTSALDRALEVMRQRFKEAEDAQKPYTDAQKKAIEAAERRKFTDRDDRKLATAIQTENRLLDEQKAKLDAEYASLVKFGRLAAETDVAKLNAKLAPGGALYGASKPDADKLRQKAAEDDAKAERNRQQEFIAGAERGIKALQEETAARQTSAREAFIAQELIAKGIDKITDAQQRQALAEQIRVAAGAQYDAKIAGPELAKWVQAEDAKVQKIKAETAALGQGALALQKAKDAEASLASAQALALKQPELATKLWYDYIEAVKNASDARDAFYTKARSASTGVQTAGNRYVEDATNQAKFAENLVTTSLRHAEDSFINLAKTGKLSLSNLFSFMAEEYLRQTFRMIAAKTLFDSSGNLLSLGSIATNIGSFFSDAGSSLAGLFSHATGSDYVPYDGYPALLHEGEKVLTKQQAQADRAGTSSGAIHFDMTGAVYNIGDGVSRGDVVSAVKAGNAQLEARIRRLMRDGKLTA